MAEIIATGKLPAMIANHVSDGIVAVCGMGMDLDEALCVVIAVVSDYARGEYGNDYLDQLAEVVRKRKEMPMPESTALTLQQRSEVQP